MAPSDIATGKDGAKRIWDEADIGSGEQSAAQHETEKMIRQIPPLPESDISQEGSDGDEFDAGDDADDLAGDEAEQADAVSNREQERSLDKDEPNDQLDSVDPVPPRG